MKKEAILIIFLALLSLNLVSAINLNVKVKPIQNSVITDLSEPAIFKLTIKNLGESDIFTIYSLVGIDIYPKTNFTIQQGETKILEIQVLPQKAILSKQGYFPFEYKIKNSLNEIQTERLTINIIKLKDAFTISLEPINPKSKKITITIKNKLNYEFLDLNAKFQSIFFNYEDSFSFKKLESKEIKIPLDIEKLKTSVAGNYLLNTNINFKSKSGDIESIIKFLEQPGIETTESKEGFLIKRNEIIKNNVGNTIKPVKITIKKNIFSYLFTTFNIVPTKTNRQGISINYIWEKDLIPNQELKIIIKTNWFFPIIIIIFIIGLYLLIKKTMERELELRKKVSFVKTKGGEFALKITIKAKAKKFIERINIIDKLPPLVELYERYGAISPDKVDLKNRRIEWNIPSLNKGEERIFTYIIYSKIGIVGKFELPKAKVVYEKQGTIKETISNRSFFINQPKS